MRAKSRHSQYIPSDENKVPTARDLREGFGTIQQHIAASGVATNFYTQDIVPEIPSLPKMYTKIVPKLNFENAAPQEDFHKIPEIVETEADVQEILINIDQTDHFYLPVDKICKKEGEVSIQLDRLNNRFIIATANQQNMNVFDKFEHKFVNLHSKKRNTFSENGHWLLQIDYGFTEDIEVKSIIENVFYPGEIESQFHQIFKKQRAENQKFDENRDFIKKIKAIKIMKVMEMCTTNSMFQRCRRYIARLFQDFLTEKYNIKFEFKILNKLFQIDEMLLTDRKSNRIYSIDLKFEEVETSLKINPYQIISYEIEQSKVDDNGEFLAIIFKVVYRDEKKTKEYFKTIYTTKVEKACDFETQIVTHRRQSSAIKGMITGVTGYMSSRFKDHQRSQTQIFDEKKVNQQQKMTQRATQTIKPMWNAHCQVLMSELGSYSIKKSKAVFGKKLENLIVVKTHLESKFVHSPSLTGEVSGQSSLFLQAAFLVQMNYSHDQYYLELQTIEIQSSQIIKHQQIVNFYPESDHYGKSIFAKLDYETDRSEELIARRCHGDGNLTFLALNSSYIFYTKLFFVKKDEAQIGVQLDLYSMISANEQPPTNPVTGKAELIVDDAQWTPDDQFVLIVLKGASEMSNKVSFPGTLCILPRLGTSFVRVLNPTRFNISRQAFMGPKHSQSASIIGSSLAAKEDIMMRPQKFMQLFISELVEQKFKPLKLTKRWQIDISPAQEEFLGKQALRIFITNSAEQVFDFVMSYDYLDMNKIERMFGLGQEQIENKKLQQKVRERNEMCFLRYCMMEPGVSSSNQLLMRIPELLEQWLPIYQYEKIQEQYEKDLRDPPQSEDPAPRSGSISANVASGNHEELYQIFNKKNQKYETCKVVAHLQKLINLCRWSDMSCHGNSCTGQKYGLLSLNFKQWMITIVNDCFFFALNKGEPILAYQILKIAENYFCSKNDPTDYYLIKSGFSLEVNQIFLDDPNSFNPLVQAIRDPQGEMFTQSSIEHKIKVELNLIQSILPINLPKNFTAVEDDSMTTVLHQFMAMKNLFQNQYSHLIFYCMIQFRNYQAASFNILFLVIANFISQRQIDPTFLRHYQICLQTLIKNYLQRKKTGEYEMFLGSQEKQNRIENPMLCISDSFKKFTEIYQKYTGKQFEVKIEFQEFEDKQLQIPKFQIKDYLGKEEKKVEKYVVEDARDIFYRGQTNKAPDPDLPKFFDHKLFRSNFEHNTKMEFLILNHLNGQTFSSQNILRENISHFLDLNSLRLTPTLKLSKNPLAALLSEKLGDIKSMIKQSEGNFKLYLMGNTIRKQLLFREYIVDSKPQIEELQEEWVNQIKTQNYIQNMEAQYDTKVQENQVVIIKLYLGVEGILDFLQGYQVQVKKNKKNKAEMPKYVPEIDHNGWLINVKDRENLFLELENHFKEIKAERKENSIQLKQCDKNLYILFKELQKMIEQTNDFAPIFSQIPKMLHVSFRSRTQRQVVYNLKKILVYQFEIQKQSTLLPFQGPIKKIFGQPKLQEQIISKKYELFDGSSFQQLLFNSYETNEKMPKNVKVQLEINQKIHQKFKTNFLVWIKLNSLNTLAEIEELSQNYPNDMEYLVCDSQLYKLLVNHPHNKEILSHLRIMVDLEKKRLNVINLQKELISQMYDQKAQIEHQLILAKFDYIQSIVELITLKDKLFEIDQEIVLNHIQNLINDHQIFKGETVPLEKQEPKLAKFENPRISVFCQQLVEIIEVVKILPVNKTSFSKVMLIKDKILKMQKSADSESIVSLIWLEITLNNFKKKDGEIQLHEYNEFNFEPLEYPEIYEEKFDEYKIELQEYCRTHFQYEISLDEPIFRYNNENNEPRMVYVQQNTYNELTIFKDLKKQSKLYQFLIPNQSDFEQYQDARQQIDIYKPALNQEKLIITNKMVHNFLLTNNKSQSASIIDSNQKEQEIFDNFEEQEEEDEPFSFHNPNHSIRMNQLGAVPQKIELSDVDMSLIEPNADTTKIIERTPIITKCSSQFLQEATFVKQETQDFTLFKLTQNIEEPNFKTVQNNGYKIQKMDPLVNDLGKEVTALQADLVRIMRNLEAVQTQINWIK